MVGNGVLIDGTPIAVDFWRERQCLKSKLFFLSHFHGDHMQGLSSSWSSKIYCSEISALLLVNDMGIQPDIVHSLEIGQTHTLDLDEIGCETMSVTLLDANHCPGAVMFLFEGYFGRVLYTGDFRYFTGIEEQSGFPYAKAIDILYLDNTYCNPIVRLPSREVATQVIIDTITNHPNWTVIIGISGLGKEDLLEQIAISLREYIVVDSKRMQRLTLLQRRNVYTDQRDRGRIVVTYCNEINDSSIGRWNAEYGPTIAIIPTALYVYANPPARDDRVFIIPYSDHSDYEGLQDFVRLVRPRCVKPIVHHTSGLLEQSWNDMSCFDDFLDPLPPCKFTIPLLVQNYMYGAPAKLKRCNSNNKRNSSSRQNTSGNRKRCRGVVFSSPAEKDRRIVMKQDNTDETAISSSTLKDCEDHPYVSTSTASPKNEQKANAVLSSINAVGVGIEDENSSRNDSDTEMNKVPENTDIRFDHDIDKLTGMISVPNIVDATTVIADSSSDRVNEVKLPKSNYLWNNVTDNYNKRFTDGDEGIVNHKDDAVAGMPLRVDFIPRNSDMSPEDTTNKQRVEDVFPAQDVDMRRSSQDGEPARTLTSLVSNGNACQDEQVICSMHIENDESKDYISDGSSSTYTDIEEKQGSQDKSIVRDGELQDRPIIENIFDEDWKQYLIYLTTPRRRRVKPNINDYFRSLIKENLDFLV